MRSFNEVASAAQLRMSFIRWALFSVPFLLLLIFLSVSWSGMDIENRWYMALEKPDFILSQSGLSSALLIVYVFQGLALATIFSARSAPLRWQAIALYLFKLLLSLFWPIYFFAMHQISGALYLYIIIFIIALAVTYIFMKIRKLAAWFMIPYLVFALYIIICLFQVNMMNPNGETLIVPRETRIAI